MALQRAAFASQAAGRQAVPAGAAVAEEVGATAAGAGTRNLPGEVGLDNS